MDALVSISTSHLGSCESVPEDPAIPTDAHSEHRTVGIGAELS
jgi:hypothetical protein